MAGIIYGLCTVTALGCAALLLRGYFRTRSRLLLWSGLCFIGLSVNNFLVVLDRIVFSGIDLSTVRLVPGLIGMMLLLYGLIWETE
jgi:hypothetical protein